MTLDKLRIKCYLGDDIRVIQARKDVIPDELLRTMEEEFGHRVIVSHYEDHERDKVTVSSNAGLQAVLSEYAEVRANNPFATLKLYLQMYPPTGKRTVSSQSLISDNTGSHVGSPSSFYSTSSSSTTSINSIGSIASIGSNPGSTNNSINNIINSVNGSKRNSITSSGHIPSKTPTHELELNLSMDSVSSPSPADSTPPIRTPPPSPPHSPRNTGATEVPPLRTPPGSPRGKGNSEPNFHRLRIDTEPNGNYNYNTNHSGNSHYPHYLLHPEFDSTNEKLSNLNLNGHHHSPHGLSHQHNHLSLLHKDIDSEAFTSSSNTPPLRTPPGSPRRSNPPSHNPPSPRKHQQGSSPSSPDITVTPPSPLFPPTEHRTPPEYPSAIPRSTSPTNIPGHALPKSPKMGTSPRLPSLILEETELAAKPLRWQKGHVLGRGGFGCVYMGLNQENGELFAVKQLELDDVEDPKSRAVVVSYAKEIEVMRSLNHENIVRYLGIQLEDNFLNIFLEYVPGGSISTLLGKFGKFPEAVIRVYTKQILSGLAYLHANRIVHRDIKGANILVDVKGMVKLADFGCSKIFAGLKSQLKTVLGTPYWMAPEVIKQTGHGRAADIWSLGCVLIEMATGQPPWQSQFTEVTAAMFHIASTEAFPDLPPHLSAEARDFLSQCFKREPKDRPDARTLLKHPFLQETPSPQPPPTLNRRASSPAQVSPQTLQQYLQQNTSTVISRSSSSRAASSSTPPRPNFQYVPSSIPLSPSARLPASLVTLPEPLVSYIFRFLPAAELVQICLVCKHLRKIGDNDALWQGLAERNLWLKRGRSTSSSSSSNSVNNNNVWRRNYTEHLQLKKLWTDSKLSCTVLKGHSKLISCLNVGDGLLASGSEDKKIKLWDLKKNKSLFSLKGHTAGITAVLFDHENARVFSSSADTTAKIWAIKSKKCIRTLHGHAGIVTGIAASDLDKKVVTSSLDKSIRVWDIETGAPFSSLMGHEGPVNSVRAEGDLVVSVSNDSTVRLWDLRTSTCVRTFRDHVGEVLCCYFANESLVSGGQDKKIRIWEVGTGKCLRKLDHTESILGLACDDAKIVSSGRDKEVKLWSWEGEASVRVMPHPEGPVFAVALDDQKLFTAGKDKVIRIWTPEKLVAAGSPAVSSPKPRLNVFGR